MTPLARISLAVALVFAALPAHAYIGPGTGLGALGAIAALFGAIVLLIVGFVWYPVKRLIQRMRGTSAAKAPVEAKVPGAER